MNITSRLGRYEAVVKLVADLLAGFDQEEPVHENRGRRFKPGIGPFGEPQLVKQIAQRIDATGIPAQTRRTPDMAIGQDWAIEFKIVRPFGDNGRPAENWSVNLLHPYPGNDSLVGDAAKLVTLDSFQHRGLLVIGYEHNPAQVILDPLIQSFELIASKLMHINLGKRIEERREHLVHPVHQVLRCFAWEVFN